jgi:hypothetical protein
MTLELAKNIADNLTVDELRDLNSYVVAKVNEYSRKRQIEASKQFRIGDIISFRAKKRFKPVIITVERINPKTLSGMEIDSTIRWNVNPTLCKKVENFDGKTKKNTHDKIATG